MDAVGFVFYIHLNHDSLFHVMRHLIVILIDLYYIKDVFYFGEVRSDVRPAFYNYLNYVYLFHAVHYLIVVLIDPYH